MWYIYLVEYCSAIKKIRVLLIPFILPTPILLWQLLIYSLYLRVFFCLSLFLLCFLNATNDWNHIVFVFLWVISLSIIPYRSIHAVGSGDLILFYGWVTFPCICIRHLLYTLIYRWILGLLPYLGYYKLWCNKYRVAYIFSN